MTFTTLSIIVFGGLVLALVHSWYRLGKVDAKYRELALTTAVITLHHGKIRDNGIELVAPAVAPEADLQVRAFIQPKEFACIRIEVVTPPTKRRRKPEPELKLDPDMATALA